MNELQELDVRLQALERQWRRAQEPAAWRWVLRFVLAAAAAALGAWSMWRGSVFATAWALMLLGGWMLSGLEGIRLNPRS